MDAQRIRNIGPNWFTSVMGTEIVANAAVLLRVHVAGLRGFAAVVWLLAAAVLVLLLVATAAPARSLAHRGGQNRAGGHQRPAVPAGDGVGPHAIAAGHATLRHNPPQSKEQSCTQRN